MANKDDTEDDVLTEIRHIGVLLEHMHDRQDSMLDILTGMNENMQTLAKQQDLEETNANVKIKIKAAVTDTNTELHDLSHRVARLEAS